MDCLVHICLNNFEILYDQFIKEGNAKSSIDICREKSILLGKEINIIKNGKTITAKAIELDNEGELIIEHSNGNVEKLISGEVSIRGLYGYV